MTEQEAQTAAEVEQSATNNSNGNDTQNVEQEEQEQILVIRGRYKYGGRNKTYGVLELIGEQDAANFSYIDLVSSSDNATYDLLLDLTNQDFRDQLQQLVKMANSQDENIIQQMRKNLSVAEILEILTDGQEEKLQEIIREKIEDEIQEEIELELNWGFLSRSELREVYPERFKTEDEATTDDLTGEEMESLSDYEGSENELNIEMKLNCSPVISAISGKLITSFSVGDEILLRITDKRELTGELKNKIKISNGLGVGTIKKIEYKEEIDRYSVLVELGNKIYGQLMVGPKVMLSYPEAKGDVAASDLNSETAQAGEDNNELGVVITVVGLFIVIIILMLLYF